MFEVMISGSSKMVAKREAVQKSSKMSREQVRKSRAKVRRKKSLKELSVSRATGQKYEPSVWTVLRCLGSREPLDFGRGAVQFNRIVVVGRRRLNAGAVHAGGLGLQGYPPLGVDQRRKTKRRRWTSDCHRQQVG